MNIVVINDDGIQSGALWLLVRELKDIARITVVAPDGERSAIGTAVSLFQPLHVKEVEAQVDGVTAYAVDGSPSDCAILALGKLAQNGTDIVVSGINPNLNLGEDVHISGTVGGALQGYFRGLPALAVSAPPNSRTGLRTAASITSMLAEKIAASPPVKIFLNINVPDKPIAEIAGIEITRLARASHINTVEEENHGQQKRYRLVRSRLSETQESGTDIQAIERGSISITPLYTSFLDKPPQRLLKKMCSEIIHEIQSG